MPREARATIRALGGAVLAAALLAGCAASRSVGSPSAVRAVGPRPGGTITVAVSGDVPTLDPAQAADTESVAMVQLLYESLFSYSPRGRLVGRLATSWSWSDGGRQLTVHLNPRARFADGSPVTAADVAFSLDRMLWAGTGAPEAMSFHDLQGFAELRAGKPWLATGIQQRGARTVVFRLVRPLPDLPELLALPSAAVVEMRLADTPAAQQSQWWFQHSAGSGPYVLAKFVPDQYLLLRPNPHYWRRGVRQGGPPVGPYATVRFVVVSSPQAQLGAFAAGRLDVLDPLAPPPQPGADGIPAQAHLLTGSNLGVSYLGFNVATAPFDKLTMRLAVAYALDKPRLLAAAGGQGEVAGGLLPPGIPGHDPALSPYPYDPARAARLFAAAGGKPGMPVTLLTIAADGTVQQGADAVAQVVAQELDAIGFQVTVRAVPWTTYYQDVAAGQDQLFQAEWIADYPDARDFFFNLLSPESIGASNGSLFANPSFVRVERMADATIDPAERVRLERELDRMAYELLPVLPEFYEQTSILVQPWLHPATKAVFLSPPLMPRLDRVWVAPHRGG